MNLQKNNMRFLLILLFGCVSLTSYGLSSDRKKIMTIVAESVEINNAKGVSKYDGNVLVRQGSMKIIANTVLVFHNKKRQIKHIIAIGRPARYKVRPDKEPYDLNASARRLEYFPAKNLMVMTKKARVKQGPRDFRSNLIKYNLVTNKVDAGRTSTGQGTPGRVNITILPDKKAK